MLVALCSVLMKAPAEDDSEALAGALRRRDPGVVAALVEQHGARLLRYLIHLVGQRALAEDLFQETWVRVLERGHQFDPGRQFGGWLFAIARHLAVDLLRRKLPASLDALEHPEEHLGERLSDRSTPTPFEAVALREQREGVAALVADLPAAHREVLFLRFTEELPLNEIARVTGVALPTVKSRLYRALGHLAERIGSEP
jgi:RNA polymerase sigma-70 factor (ECF subfamily)